MTQVIEGVIHGRTIVLNGDPGVADGSQVQVVLQVDSPSSGREPPDRKTAAGRMANYTDDDDAVLAEIYQDRRRDTRREPPL